MGIARETRQFATEDMTLVTLLKVKGVEPREMVRSGKGCQWVFDHSRAVEDLVDEYQADEAYVEPREFARKMGLVRSEMYRFLGVAPRRVRD